MQRKMVEIELPDDGRRYRVIYSDEVECDPFSSLSRRRQDEMLNEFLMNYDLRRCGPAPFRTMKMFHDGGRWIIELETEEYPNGR